MSMQTRLLFATTLAATLLGCDPKDTDTSTGADTNTGPSFDSAAPYVDNDGDGWSSEDGDCDDSDPDIVPGQEDTCDGIDNNCNDLIDEGSADSDGDAIADCVDVEECDGIDNDGDGLVDEEFSDTDSNGIADCAEVEACDGIDNNGDGVIDEGFDADGDGYTSCGDAKTAPDCDDTDATISPGAAESDGDLIDNDCDGGIDEGSWRRGDLVITEIMNNPIDVSDLDGEWFEVYNASGQEQILNGVRISDDGSDYHIITSAEILTIGAGEFRVFGRSDDTSVNGGVAVDYAYGGDLSLSNESDALIMMIDDVELDIVRWDDGVTMPDPSGTSMSLDIWYIDADLNDITDAWCPTAWPDIESSDVLSTPGEDNALCPTIDHDGDNYSIEDGDCDDTNADISPDAGETPYDGIDNDCDPDTFDDDVDQDGYLVADDCDDNNDTVYPGADELCDGVDNDCDELSDDEDSDVIDIYTWYVDDDGDGFGDEGATGIDTCDVLSGYATNNEDCDDEDEEYNPDAVEDDCDDPNDYNCDGQVGDRDEDEDGFSACETDCDDTDPLVFPYAWEDTSDGIDNDCDGYTDTADPDTPSYLSLSDDSSARITLSAGFPFCGSNYTTANVISNGRILFGSSTTTYSESLTGHTAVRNISGVWDDLNPSSGGRVATISHSDAFAVHFREVSEYGSTGNTVSFSIIMFDDGRVIVSYENVDVTDGLAGWSCGRGSSGETDLTDAVSEVAEDAAGIGTGTENYVYELFSGGSDSNDLGGYTFPMCMNLGSDSDGDGYTDECGDPDDSDSSVTP